MAVNVCAGGQGPLSCSGEGASLTRTNWRKQASIPKMKPILFALSVVERIVYLWTLSEPPVMCVPSCVYYVYYLYYEPSKVDPV